jgi:hypothetical protein
MQPEKLRAPGAEFDEVKCRRPSNLKAGAMAALRLTLDFDAIVPDLIAPNSVPFQILGGNRILDTEFECDDAHFGSALLKPGLIKSASSAGKPLARSHFVLQPADEYKVVAI